MAKEDFPQTLHITRDLTEDFLLANRTPEEAVGGSYEPVEIAEYAFIKSFKARAAVQVVEKEGEREEA